MCRTIGIRSASKLRKKKKKKWRTLVDREVVLSKYGRALPESPNLNPSHFSAPSVPAFEPRFQILNAGTARYRGTLTEIAVVVSIPPTHTHKFPCVSPLGVAAVSFDTSRS